MMTLCDSFDAMISDRPYRESLSREEAIDEIRQGAGTQFDPELAERFIEMLVQRKTAKVSV